MKLRPALVIRETPYKLMTVGRGTAKLDPATSPHFSSGAVAKRPRRRGDKARDQGRRRRTRQYVEAADRAQRSIRERIGRCSGQPMRNAG